MKNFIKSGKIYYSLVFAYISFTFLVMIFSLDIYGKYHFFTNKSGSMAPFINKGSLTLTKKEDVYRVGDVIAYYSQKGGIEEIVTHRIMQVGGNVYLTKGDSNPGFDRPLILPRLIIGRVIMVIPYLGHILAFAKSSLGMWFVIILPACAIVGFELTKILAAVTIRT